MEELWKQYDELNKRPPDSFYRQIYVYFFMMHTFIKIGHSHDPADRRINVQNACPYHVHVVATFKGNAVIEKMLHTIWRKYRLKGEWFQISEEIAEFIKGAQETENKEAYLHGFLAKNRPR